MSFAPRRLFVALLTAAFCATVTAFSSASAQHTPRSLAASSYTAVQARGSEYKIGLSRTRAKPGTVKIEFDNYGEDDHDLAVTRLGSGTIANTDIVHPGKLSTLKLRLHSGTYVLWCTISDHKSRGMRAVLKVRK